MSTCIAPHHVPSALAAVLALGAACGSPPAVTGSPGPSGLLDVRGRYTVGFERNVFEPCGGTRGWWVGPLDAVPAVRAEVDARRGANLRRWVTVYVRWQGTLSDSGRYGDVGAFPYEFRPRAASEVRDTTGTDCR